MNEALLKRMHNVLKEVENLALLIKAANATNEQEVIEYENELNRYSTIDYNEL